MSQMRIKRKACDTRTWKQNLYFSTYPPAKLIHLSHRSTTASKPAAQKCFVCVVSATSAQPSCELLSPSSGLLQTYSFADMFTELHLCLLFCMVMNLGL
jgi:hypothetical protein